jgi:hypothetical protein
MANMRTRNDFVIKDLVVTVPSESGGGAGGTWLPAEDGPPLPWWISPVAGVLVKGHVLEAVTATMQDALKKGGDFDDIGRAFREGDPDGNPAIQIAIHDIGSAVVASAAFAAMGGGSVGLPDPNCGGTSLETIPPTLTPIVHKGLEIHRVSELPKLRRQLAMAVEALDRVAASLEPRGSEVGIVKTHLEKALNGLGG